MWSNQNNIYLTIGFGLTDPADERVQIVDNLQQPALIVALLQRIPADLGYDTDTATNHSSLYYNSRLHLHIHRSNTFLI